MATQLKQKCRRSRRPRILLFPYLFRCVVLLAIGTGFTGCQAILTPTTPINESILYLIQNSSQVETYRLSRNPPAKPLAGHATPLMIDGYYVATIGPVEPHPFAVKLAKILSQPKTYGPEVPAIIVMNFVLLRVKSPTKTVDIMLDFGSYYFSISSFVPGAPPPHDIDVESCFMHNAAPVYYLCKTAFPKVKYFARSD